MRTTLSLDDDVAAQLDQLRSEGRPYKQLVNHLLRLGLAHLDDDLPQDKGPYTHPSDLGGLLLPDVDDVSEVLALVEGDSHR